MKDIQRQMDRRMDMNILYPIKKINIHIIKNRNELMKKTKSEKLYEIRKPFINTKDYSRLIKNL